MKKALFITHMLNRTGAPLVLMQMMDVFSRNSYNVDVISMEDGVLREDLEARGITVDVIDHPTQHQEEFKKRLKGYDIVVCNTLLTVFFILIMQGEKVPVLWWIHEGRTYFEMYKKILSLYAAKSENIRILSVSPIVHNLIKEYLGIDSDIVPFAAPENEILPDSSHMWQNDKLKLIMTGQLSFLKGQDIFIDALNLLPEQMAEKMQIIMCLGANENDAEVVSKVNAASEKYHNITVIDSVPHDEMLSLISSADFLLANSRYESMPTVAAEAWMVGTPAILSDACGIGYYAEVDMKKLIYKACDSKALSDLLIKCFQIVESDRYDALVQEGREVYRANFTSEIFEQNVLKEIAIVSNSANRVAVSDDPDSAVRSDAEPKGRLICMVGRYDDCDMLMYRKINECMTQGYEVYLFDTSKMTESLSYLEPFLRTRVNAVLTYRNVGADIELIPGKNLWEQLSIPIIDLTANQTS